MKPIAERDPPVVSWLAAKGPNRKFQELLYGKMPQHNLHEGERVPEGASADVGHTVQGCLPLADQGAPDRSDRVVQCRCR